MSNRACISKVSICSICFYALLSSFTFASPQCDAASSRSIQSSGFLVFFSGMTKAECPTKSEQFSAFHGLDTAYLSDGREDRWFRKHSATYVRDEIPSQRKSLPVVSTQQQSQFRRKSSSKNMSAIPKLEGYSNLVGD